jgi:hypothetical protein
MWEYQFSAVSISNLLYYYYYYYYVERQVVQNSRPIDNYKPTRREQEQGEGGAWRTAFNRCRQDTSVSAEGRLAVPWLRWSIAGLSLSSPRSFHLGFVLGKVALGQVLS